MEAASLGVLLPLSDEAIDTLRRLAQRQAQAQLRVSPFCHEARDSTIRGWMLSMPAEAWVSSLPVPHNLFHGVSVVMCEASEIEILNLMRQEEQTRALLGRAIHEVQLEAYSSSNPDTVVTGGGGGGNNNKDKDNDNGGAPPPPAIIIGSAPPFAKEASWKRCRPVQDTGVPFSMHGVMRNKNGGLDFVAGAPPIIDSEPWCPALSPDGFIGLYVRWQGDDDSRITTAAAPTSRARLRLYMVCQSYLEGACLEFMDLVQRLPDSACNAGCVSLSEEAQWLRSACSRNRARLIERVASRMGLRVPTILDYSASPSTPNRRMALVCSETLHHDLRFIPGGNSLLSGAQVRILNYCAETSNAFNGSICTMAPWEGIWIFRGGLDHPSSSSSSLMTMCGGRTGGGDFFGQPDSKAGLVMPTASPTCPKSTAANATTMIVLRQQRKRDDGSNPAADYVITHSVRPFQEFAVLRVFPPPSSRGAGGGEGGSMPAAGTNKTKRRQPFLSSLRGGGGGPGAAAAASTTLRMASSSNIAASPSSSSTTTMMMTPEQEIALAYQRTLVLNSLLEEDADSVDETLHSSSSSTLSAVTMIVPPDHPPSYPYYHHGGCCWGGGANPSFSSSAGGGINHNNNNGGMMAKKQQQQDPSSSSWNYLTFNEAVLDQMKQNGWRRERSGVCRLTPIGVGFFEPWHAAMMVMQKNAATATPP